MRVNVAATLVYLLLGVLGGSLSLTLDDGPTVWLAAGGALSFVMVHGARVLPGIWLATFLINLALGRAFHGRALLGAAALGVLNAGTPYAARWLVQRWRGSRALTGEPYTVAATLVSGVLCHGVGAIASVHLIKQLGFLPRADLLSTTLLWWLGNSLGLLVIVPVGWMLLEQGARLGRRSVLLALTLPLTLLLLIVALHAMARRGERARLEQSFRNRGAVMARLLQEDLRSTEDALLAFGFSGLQGKISPQWRREVLEQPDVFRHQAREILRRRHHLSMIGFAPRLQHEEREAFERLMPPSFGHLWARPVEPDTIRLPLGVQPSYVPILSVEPGTAESRWLGMDLSTLPAMELTLREAFLSGQPRALPLPWESASRDPSTLLMVLPLHADVPHKDALSEGYLVTMLSLDLLLNDIILESLRPPGVKLRFALSEESSREVEQVVPGRPTQIVFSQSMPLVMGRRPLWLSVAATGDYLRQAESSLPLAVVIGGCLTLALFGLLVRQVALRGIAVQELIEQRTRQLRAARTESEMAAHEARAASAAKSRFLATMSHELRTPLNGILGSAELLRGMVRNEEERTWVATILTSGRGLLTLLNDLLDYTRAESVGVSMRMENVELRSVIRQSLDVLSSESTRKQLDLSLAVDDDVPGWVMIDPGRLRQILLNVVGNALKFTERGRVQVRISSCGLDDGHPPLHVVRFVIQDSGPGIPAHSLQQIFQPFFQVEDPVGRKQGGAGLGLAICQRFCERLGGRIWAESEPGQGTRILFELPLQVMAPPAEVRQAPPPVVPLDSTRPPLLLVEDNPINRRVALKLLAQLGYPAESAETGEEALRMAEQRIAEDQPYQLVLMDVQLPGIDGLETTRRLLTPREGMPPPVVVALTAQTSEYEVKACLESGMSFHIPKPISMELLTTAMSRAQALVSGRFPVAQDRMSSMTGS